MNVFQAALLGIVQGLTEFLPVSSSGHLVLGEALLGVNPAGGGFEVFAHLGTLLAILVHYRRDLLEMAGSVLRARRDESSRTFLLILLASIPAAVVGIVFEDRISELFDRPAAAAAFLLVTGVMLLATKFAKAGDKSVGPVSAILIGLAQAVAILPGISRSGATISTGIFAGIQRERAARFSFLLVVPALLGAAALTLAKHPPDTGMMTVYLTGAVAAFGSGYLALRWILIAVARDRFPHFGWYCLAVGTVALIWLLP